MFQRDFCTIEYYTPTAAELERKRKERQEIALTNWHNLIWHCQEAKKNGVCVTMRDAIRHIQHWSNDYTPLTTKEALLYWQEEIDDRLKEIEREKDKKRCWNLGVQFPVQGFNTQHKSDYFGEYTVTY